MTAFRVLSRGRAVALVEALPRTGRTHQIRLHLAHEGHPVLGDARYGGPPCERMMLHCRAMSFRAADGRTVAAEAPGDDMFAAVCARAGIVQRDTPARGGHSVHAGGGHSTPSSQVNTNIEECPPKKRVLRQ